MTLVLVVESGTGLANANAFASLATVTAAIAALPFAGTTWEDKTVAERNAIVAEATAILSRQSWQGSAVTGTQALAFPRAGLTTRDGWVLDQDIVPAFVVDALARVSLWLASQSASPYETTGLQPGTELEVGPIRLTPAGGGTMPLDIRLLLAPYVVSSHTLVRA